MRKTTIKLFASLIICLMLSVGVMAGDISSGSGSGLAGDISSGGSVAGDISSGGSAAGDISSGVTEADVIAQIISSLTGILLGN